VRTTELEALEAVTREGEPDVAVLASSDAVYLASGEGALRRIRGACPDAFIVLAGRRGTLAEPLLRVAPSLDVFAGADVVAVLAEILQTIRSARPHGVGDVQ
jgi:hypothetical protein